ncbi:MAG: 4-alpha-glucanotransferase [Luteolibacter sp.]
MEATAERLAGVLLPVFSTRRRGDLGIGDTEGLRQWIDWAAEHSVGFIQVLPINENGSEESPYSAISSMALDPIYLTLDTAHVPWLSESEISAARIALGPALDAPEVDYPLVRRIKRNLLELAWSKFHELDDSARDDYEAFRQHERGWLDDYSLFRLLMEHHGESLSWDQWPHDCHTPRRARAYVDQMRQHDAAGVDYRLGYFVFVQWLCYQQWDRLKKHADAKHVMLMGDMPIGVSWHSSDVFFQPEQFHLEWFGGSPPEGHHVDDPFFQQWGQNWGVPLYRWDHMQSEDFAWWRGRVSHLTRFFRMFRIDHILGFYRIYAFPWNPARNAEFIGLTHDEAAKLTHGRLPHWVARADDNEENRRANRADGDPRLRAVIDAAGGARVIAEDLGWVPSYVRPHLQELGIAGYRIPHWDCDATGHPLTGEQFPENSFAVYSTHDHDPINGIWRACHEIVERSRASSDGESADAVHGARWTLRVLGNFAGIPVDGAGQCPPFTEAIQLSLIKALLATRSRYAGLMVTELFDLNVRINRPGSHRGNWKFRIPWTIDEIMQDRRLSGSCRQFASIIGITGRAP